MRAYPPGSDRTRNRTPTLADLPPPAAAERTQQQVDRRSRLRHIRRYAWLRAEWSLQSTISSDALLGASRRVRLRVGSLKLVFDGEELPWVGDAFERMGAAISEGDA
jgi:hypothetical protein